MIRAHAFTGEHHVHGVAGFRVGTVEEQINACDVSVDKARRFKCRLGRRQIRAKDQQVHVLGEPHGRLINSPHPGRNRIASDDCVSDARIFQSRSRPQQTVLDEFHGSYRPFPGLQAQRQDRHSAILSSLRQFHDATSAMGK